jgi:segregation and condensation protein B
MPTPPDPNAPESATVPPVSPEPPQRDPAVDEALSASAGGTSHEAVEAAIAPDSPEQLDDALASSETDPASVPGPDPAGPNVDGPAPDETAPGIDLPDPALPPSDTPGAADASEPSLSETPDPMEAPPVGALRIAEALVFASATPVTAARLAPLLPEGVSAAATLAALAAIYADRGVNLVAVAGGYAFRTAPDLAPTLTRVVEVPRRLPRVAMEALAIIAWHQPVTRAEIEEIRGTALSQNSLEALLENGLIAPRGRKEAPGRPMLWATTPRFLEQFGLNSLRDLPRREELLPEPGLPLSEPVVELSSESEPEPDADSDEEIAEEVVERTSAG